RNLPVRTPLFGDKPQILLEDIQEYRRQEAAWKKDSASEGARRERSKYLLTRARQLVEDGDAVNADRLIREAEAIKVKRGLADLRPEQIRQQLARRPGGAKPSSAVVHAGGFPAAGSPPEGQIRQVGGQEEGPSPEISPSDAGDTSRATAKPTSTPKFSGPAAR